MDEKKKKQPGEGSALRKPAFGGWGRKEEIRRERFEERQEAETSPKPSKRSIPRRDANAGEKF